jgi:hypothetical protein
MRLSLKRGAHAVLSRAAYRKFEAFRSFLARCGIPQVSPSSLSRVLQLRTGAPCSHQRCPDFLLRRTSHDHACGFLLKKVARRCSTPPTSTGNPGYVGRKRWAKPHHSLSFRTHPFFIRTGGIMGFRPTQVDEKPPPFSNYSPRRTAPLCHLDRSVPGFPTSRCWQRPRVRFSLKKTA